MGGGVRRCATHLLSLGLASAAALALPAGTAAPGAGPAIPAWPRPIRWTPGAGSTENPCADAPRRRAGQRPSASRPYQARRWWSPRRTRPGVHRLRFRKEAAAGGLQCAAEAPTHGEAAVAGRMLPAVSGRRPGSVHLACSGRTGGCWIGWRCAGVPVASTNDVRQGHSIHCARPYRCHGRCMWC